MSDERPVVGIHEMMKDTSLSDRGALNINPALTDKEIGGLVRRAMEATSGMPFTVTQNLGSVIFNDLKYLASKYGDDATSETDD